MNCDGGCGGLLAAAAKRTAGLLALEDTIDVARRAPMQVDCTGFTGFKFSIGGKWVELLKQIDPGLSRVAVIFNPETSPQSKLWLTSIEAGAQLFGVEAIAKPVHHTADIERVISEFSPSPTPV